MQAADVLDIVSALDADGVVCWLDGGWGVACLLGEQTRPIAFRDDVGRAVDLRPVRCASAEDQRAMHLGYDPRPVDMADVRRLAARFDLPLPPGLAPTDGGS